jgi:DNA-binding NarL/FixJ family response regulator
MRLNKRLHRTDNSDPAVPKVDYDQIQETRLTPRQLQILKFVSEGMTTKEIADELFISVKTVETHRGQIMERLKIHDLAGLIRHAIRMGLTSLD